MTLLKHFDLVFFIGYFLMEIYFFIRENTYFKLKHTTNCNNIKKIMYGVIFLNGNTTYTTFSIFNKITHFTITSYSIFNILTINTKEIK